MVQALLFRKHCQGFFFSLFFLFSFSFFSFLVFFHILFWLGEDKEGKVVKPHYDCASWSGVGGGYFEKPGTAGKGQDQCCCHSPLGYM